MSYFFTVNLAQRGDRLLVDHIELLRDAYGSAQNAMPFRTVAIVVLPDHLHAIWTLPEGDADYSTRWKLIKRNFTVNLGKSLPRSLSKRRKGEAGIWQRRFWEHMIRDDTDMKRHMVYTLCNPVKHGLVKRSVDWPYSSLHRDIKVGTLPEYGL